MMFAEGEDFNILDNDHFIMVLVKHSPIYDFYRQTRDALESAPFKFSS